MCIKFLLHNMSVIFLSYSSFHNTVYECNEQYGIAPDQSFSFVIEKVSLTEIIGVSS